MFTGVLQKQDLLHQETHSEGGELTGGSGGAEGMEVNGVHSHCSSQMEQEKEILKEVNPC